MRRFAIILWLSLGLVNAYPQVLDDWQRKIENYEQRIVSIEFFMDRFNQPLAKATEGKPIDSAQWKRLLLEREHNLLTTFDMSQWKRNDGPLAEKINGFFRYVNNEGRPRFIHFEDDNWFAMLEMETAYQSKNERMICFMKVEMFSDRTWAWVFKGITLPDKNISERLNGKFVFDPAVHGTDFMEVMLSLNDVSRLKTRPPREDIESSLILQQMLKGERKIKGIHQITYHFLQLEGYKLSVKYFNRESKNSGWLIDNLTTMDVAGKQAFLRSNCLQ